LFGPGATAHTVRGSVASPSSATTLTVAVCLSIAHLNALNLGEVAPCGPSGRPNPRPRELGPQAQDKPMALRPFSYADPPRRGPSARWMPTAGR